MSDRRFVKRIQILNGVKCTRRTSTLNRKSSSDSHCKVKCTILIVYNMAQSATQKRTPLGIEHFREKPSADPTLKWEKWQMQAKLALHARENIALDILLKPKPDNVQLPLEPIYESTITGSPAQSEWERLARIAQLKINWENQCQKQMEIGIMCGNTPWTQADRKTVSMLYLSLDTEGRRIICSRNPHLKIVILTTVELWQIMESTFIRRRNITFDRYMLLTNKKSKGESIEDFFWKIEGIVRELRSWKSRKYFHQRSIHCHYARSRNSTRIT